MAHAGRNALKSAPRSPEVRRNAFSRAEGVRFPRWVIAAVVLAAIGLVTGFELIDRFLEVRDSTVQGNAVGIAGPPCPSVSRAEFVAQGLETRWVSNFNGVIIGRRFGEVSCSEVATKGGLGVASHPVCQFNAPDVLAVRIGKEMSYFRPGIGRKASVVVRNGAPRCILAAPDWS